MKKILIIFMFLFLLTGCGNKNNELVMVTEAGFAPYEYYEDGKIVGVDVDIANEIAKKMGEKFSRNSNQIYPFRDNQPSFKIIFSTYGPRGGSGKNHCRFSYFLLLCSRLKE